MLRSMVVPEQPVTLSPEQIVEVSRKLSHMRHDINNHLTMMVAAAEMIKLQPPSAPQRVTCIMDQVPKVTKALAEFTAEFERLLGVHR